MNFRTPPDDDPLPNVGCSLAAFAAVVIGMILGLLLLLADCGTARADIAIIPPVVTIRSPVLLTPRPVVPVVPVAPVAPLPLPPPQPIQVGPLAKPPIGTVLVSRNIDERENTSPGSYWNHTAIMVSSDYIVEAQPGRGVIYTHWSEYERRPYSRVVIFRPWSEYAGNLAAHRAQLMVGQRYAPYASAWPFNGPIRQRLGSNCVSTIEIAYCIPDINTPDGMFRVQHRMFHPPETLR